MPETATSTALVETQSESPIHGQKPAKNSLPDTQPKPKKNALSKSDKQQLAILLSQTCALQKQYGKTRAELETLVEGFAWAMEGHTIAQITKAMREYILNNSDIPAPADILKIIKLHEEYGNLSAPTVETLRRWRSKGIPLNGTPRANFTRRRGRRMIWDFIICWYAATWACVLLELENEGELAVSGLLRACLTLNYFYFIDSIFCFLGSAPFCDLEEKEARRETK